MATGKLMQGMVALERPKPLERGQHLMGIMHQELQLEEMYLVLLELQQVGLQ